MTMRLRDMAVRYGFIAVLVVLFLGFSLGTPHFASIGNVLAMLHTMAPLVVMSGGLALVVLAGKLDISIGSIAFLSSTVATLLMNNHGVPPSVAFAAALGSGIVLGALNGFIVVVLGINPLIATLGTMITLRGLGLELTNAVMIPLPDTVRTLGNAMLGPVFLDVLIAAVLIVLLDGVHRRTVFGRQLNAIGNSEEVAARIGLKVRPLVFMAFVLSGLTASIGGLMSLVQVGAISAYLGKGTEFTAVAVVVVGGISLFGGRGRIVPGVVLGALTFQIIENGLNQMSASPYAYRIVTGAIIFVAMYVDALNSGRPRPTRSAAATTVSTTMATAPLSQS